MDGLFVLAAIITLLILLDAAAARFGVDSRDGFVDDRIRWRCN